MMDMVCSITDIGANIHVLIGLNKEAISSSHVLTHSYVHLVCVLIFIHSYSSHYSSPYTLVAMCDITHTHTHTIRLSTITLAALTKV